MNPVRIVDCQGKERRREFFRRLVRLLYKFSQCSQNHVQKSVSRYDTDGCTVNVKSSLALKWEEAGYGHYGLTPQDLLDQSFKVKYNELVTNVDVSKN